MKLSGDWAVLSFRVLLPCIAAQNFVTGLTYGSFGALLATNEAYFGVSRALVSTGIGVYNLAVALLAPLIGGVMHKFPVRLTMTTGAVVSALAYFGLAFTHSFPVALLCYGLLGCCSAMLGILGPATLISRWFVKGRARALASIYMPIVMLVMPFIVAAALPHVGRTGVMIGIGACFLLLLPLLAMIVERPRAEAALDGQAPDAVKADHAGSEEQPYATRVILAEPLFWLLSLGIGIMAGAGTGFLVHIIPFGTERGMSLQMASGLLSTYAASGLVGTLLFGWVADRFGSGIALAISTSCQAVIWTALLSVSGFAIYALAAMMGLCLSSVNALHGSAMNEIFPVASVGRALGLSYAVKLPFILGTAPVVALLYEVANDYSLPFVTLSVIVLFASANFAIMQLILRHRKRPALATA